MAELWAVVASWATPTAVFLLLNGLVALTYIFACTDRLPPARLLRTPPLLSHVSSFNFSKLIHNSNHSYSSASGGEPPENEPIARASSHPSPVDTVNRSAEQETYSATGEASPPTATSSSHGDCAVVAETKPISRAPHLLSRITSFKGIKGFSLHRSAVEDTNPPDSEDAPAAGDGQRITRADTEPRKRMNNEAARETKMRKSSSEKEQETASSGEEVDTMADDFIKRFKQQLRLQRLDSLLRFRKSAEAGQ